ncbi:hypothetical protein H681_02640 [Pseudomonas sp. ATCC 13867]|uniref:DUF805 domain-containing protein n=1 Tax=Pseudomonas sp. ATCC 13867 TaxID=1294143 RepID=UPI0002C4E290|nr:DUF805 domain-containing protein [Pseudomonas sp. ATCC 13867]AGI22410.1 hypothetical protein H681_02640 [Pseudomonas sp. ATCC 13867]RFQ28916.1 DUF805 domain-containing protein [Pseudomonas sp. ATCC 13867]
MDQARFKIVFDGTLMPQTPMETAKENLARLFKSDTSKIDALFSGKPVVLKRDLSDDEADKYLRALHGAGANARKEADGKVGLSLVETDDHPSEATLASRAAAEAADGDQMTCPKCGHVQPRSGECSACGIIIEKYLARQAELAATGAAPTASAPGNVASATANSPYAPPQANVSDELPEYGELNIRSLSGRIGRVRYLGWSAALSLICFAAYLVASLLLAVSLPLGVVALAVVVIAAAVFSVPIGVQRLHDLGWSGWLWLALLVPFVNAVLSLVMLFMPGEQTANRYGPPPPPNSTSVKVLAFTWLLFPVVAGILAAIALPAYQQYVERAQATQYQSAEPDAAATAEPSDEFNSGDTEGADSDDESSTEQ